MNKPLCIVYSALVLAIILVPSVGMLWARSDTTTENKTLAELPSLENDDGTLNSNLLKGLGDYFDDHFAYREQMVTANAWVRSALFRTSATDQVVIGNDGWPYFSGTIDDYIGANRLTERGMFNATYNLELASEYVESHGSHLVVTIAPDKNFLYPEYMPNRYIHANTADIEEFSTALERRGIDYVDLTEVFKNRLGEGLYFKRDTHWNNLGASYAYEALMSRTGGLATAYAGLPFDVVANHNGDLDAILYPLATTPEADIIFRHADAFSYVEGSSPEDDWIETESAAGTGTLLMFRDSFGNALLPFFANDYMHLYYSKLMPYDLEQVDKYKPDCVVIERAQRHIPGFATSPALFDAPERDVTWTDDIDSSTQMRVKANGQYYDFYGVIDSSCMEVDSKIYLVFTDDSGQVETTREASPQAVEISDSGALDDNGFIAHVHKNALSGTDATVSVVVSSNGAFHRLFSQSYELPGS